MRLPNAQHSHRRIATRYYYAIGIILFLLGITLMLMPHALHREGELWRSLGEVGTFLALIVALHYIYELLIKKEDRQLWTDELVSILETHLVELKRILQLSRATVHDGQEVAYAAVTDAIVRMTVSKKGEKTLLMGALYDHAGKRKTLPRDGYSMHHAFTGQMHDCITSSGPDKWCVKELYNITTEDRLNLVVDRIESADGAPGYEVRAFCIQNAIPQLTPLIVGSEDLFIGWDDSTYYGVKGVVHIHGHEFVRSASEYFDSLWNDRRVFVLRSELGKDINGIDSLRHAIRTLHDGLSHPSAGGPSHRRRKNR